jgi:flavin-dependent dehydrogenase
MTDVDFDVGIVGGGPAGASMGAYLAKAGIKCVIFEKALFPRPHVGESFVPSSTRVLKELDFLPTMEAKKFPKKYGAAWTSSEKVRPYQMNWKGVSDDCHPSALADELRPGVADITFAERAQPGVDQPYTYHVDRGEFDLALLQHANKLGAEVYEGVNVTGVTIDEPGVSSAAGEPDPLVHFQIGRREVKTRVRVLVDASGRRTFLGSQLKLKVMDPVFDQYAIHSWFEGLDRGEGPAAGFIHIHFLPITNSWVWQIPVSETVTSVGVVTQKKNFLGSKASRQEFFWQCLRSREELADKVAKAEQVRPFTEEADYSYSMKQTAGERFVMLGDAARFVDPIFSTGVSIALNSARFAQADVRAALERGPVTRQSFATFESTMRRGIKNWYDFINVYYRLNVLFTYFVQSKQHRLDVLKLLQGDVYEEDAPPVLRLMQEKVREVEQNPGHMWHGLLGSLTAGAYTI